MKSFSSFKASTRAETAAFAPVPIFPKAIATSLRINESLSYLSIYRQEVGTAIFDAEPIFPRASIAHHLTLSSFNSSMRIGTAVFASEPILPASV